MECMGMYGWRVGVGSSCTLRLGLLCGSGATCAQGSTVVVGVCERSQINGAVTRDRV